MRSFQTVCMFSESIPGGFSGVHTSLPISDDGRVIVAATDAEDAARRACTVFEKMEDAKDRDVLKASEYLFVWRLTWNDGKDHPQAGKGASPTIITGPAYDPNVAVGDDYVSSIAKSEATE